MASFTPYFQQFGQAFGVSPTVLGNIAQLESSMNPGAMNNWDSNAAAGTPSGGLMQFIEPTFNDFYSKASAAKPGLFRQLGPKNWMDPQQQIATTAWAIANGLGSHWATYGRAGGPSIASEGPVSHSPASASPTGGADLALANIHAARGEAGPELMKMIDAYSMQAQPSVAGSFTGLPQRVPMNDAGGYYANVGDSGKDYTFLQRLGMNRFGLENDPGVGQTTGGSHMPGSYHYTGHAVDFGSARNSPQQLESWWNYLNKNRENLGLAELIWESRGTPNEHIHAALGR